MKRILIIVLILAAAAGIILAGVLLRSGGEEEGPDGGLPGDGSFLPIGSGGTGTGTGEGDVPGGGSAVSLNLVSRASVLDYTANPTEGLLIIDAGGAVISFASSSETIIARANFGDVHGAWFSPNGMWLLVRSGSSDLTRWSLLDIEEKTWRDVPANTDEMDWSPDSSRLAYITKRTNDSALTLLDPETGNIQPVLTLSAPDLTLKWRNAGNLTLMDRPSVLAAGNIWNFSVADEVLRAIKTNVSGGHVAWDGTGERGLLFRAGPTGGVLELIDRNGNVSRAANFLTLPSKCLFGSGERLAGNIFCAIPQDPGLLKNSQLPDDYLKKEFATSDALYAIDLVSGAIVPVTPSSQTFTFDAANLRIYGDELYFTDRNTRNLYRVPLTRVIEAAPGAYEEEYL